jgi:peptidoglycan/LPS O-acetylase OafA/YrhL
MFKAPETADCQIAGYRPHIDGLRAVAVLSVIVFHLSDKFLLGGYLGVDMFFVISGFLITNVIWQETNDGIFSIARFYERRIRRIMPALVTMLAVTSCPALAILLPTDLTRYAKSLASSLGFAANVYFWRDTDYFNQLASESPLLHLWSLGIEEQFYIIFPLCVIVCAKWRRSALLPITSFLVAVSFAANAVPFVANIIGVRIGGYSPAFYLLPTRAWELGAGCILAIVPTIRMPKLKVAPALGVLAVSCLAIGLFLNGSLVPAGLIPPALWVVTGTCLTIRLGDAEKGWLTRSLSNPFLVWIGLISYSLYLWHWPILAFGRYFFVQHDLSVPLSLCALALMFVLAALSWRYVERPFRNRSMPIRTVCARMGCAVAVLSAGSLAMLLGKGFPNRYPPDIVRINAAVNTSYRCELSRILSFGGYRACIIGEPGLSLNDATVAVLGNSHAQMYAPIISDILLQEHRAGVLAHLNHCLPLADYNQSHLCMEEAAENQVAVESLTRVQVVILAMTWDLDGKMYTRQGIVPLEDEAKIQCESLDRVIRRFNQLGKKVVLVGPVATPGYDLPSELGRAMAFGHAWTKPLYGDQRTFLNQYHEVFSHFAGRKDVTFVRPDLSQCQDGRCDFIRDGLPLFSDSNHLAIAPLYVFRPTFDPAVRKVLDESAK